MDYLLIIQTGSLVLTACTGLMLALSRVHLLSPVRKYEVSRWFLVASAFILSLHYFLQIHFGFRASGDDVGAVVNILFYAPVTYMLSFAMVNLNGNHNYRKRYLICSSISYAVILLTFLAGFITYGTLHIGHFLDAMGVEFFLSVLYAVVDPFKENRHMRQELESDTAGDLRVYRTFMFTGTIILLIVGILVPAIIFMRPLLFVLGPLFLIMLFVYYVNFIGLGFNLSSFADILTRQESAIQPEVSSQEQQIIDEEMTDQESDAIQASINAWIERGGYSNPDVTLSRLAKVLNCSTQELSHYISCRQGSTFRVWLSKIRLEEAKRMLVNKSDATIESIAEECGFSSRSYFQNTFKAETGFTPREWRFKMGGVKE